MNGKLLLFLLFTAQLAIVFDFFLYVYKLILAFRLDENKRNAIFFMFSSRNKIVLKTFGT